MGVARIKRGAKVKRKKHKQRSKKNRTLLKAYADYDKDVATYTRRVERKGREDLAPDLAMSLSNRGFILEELGRPRQALADYDKAISIYTRLVKWEGREDLSDDFARSLDGRATVLTELGKLREAPRGSRQGRRHLHLPGRAGGPPGSDLGACPEPAQPQHHPLRTGQAPRGARGLRSGGRHLQLSVRGGGLRAHGRRLCPEPQQPQHRPW